MKLRENEKVLKQYNIFKQAFSFFGLIKKSVSVQVSNYRMIIESNYKGLFRKSKRVDEVYLNGVSKISVAENSTINLLPILLFILTAGLFTLFLVLFILDEEAYQLILFILFAVGMGVSIILMFLLSKIKSFGLMIYSVRKNVPLIGVSNCIVGNSGNLRFSNVKPISNEENGYEAFADEISTYLNNNVEL